MYRSPGVWLGSRDIGENNQLYWVQHDIPTDDGSMFLPSEPAHSYGDCLVNYWNYNGNGLYVEHCEDYTAPFVCVIS